MLPNPLKTVWWHEPPDRIRLAYYMLLRVRYGMPALEAWERVNRVKREYPAMLSSPIEAIRSAIKN